jgi:hypothetical protein
MYYFPDIHLYSNTFSDKKSTILTWQRYCNIACKQLIMYNSEREVEKLCFSIRQNLKASIDRQVPFTHLVGSYNISLEFINNNELVLQAKRTGSGSYNYRMALSKAICDYYDIEKSVASLILQYDSAVA